MHAENLDAVTIEIIQNALNSFIREMRGLIIRTAFGPVIWETHDFSCGLLGADGELVALSEDNPVHIVPTTYSVPAVRTRFGDDIAQGDIFVMNDPYVLGTHMNDVAHLYPFFADDRLLFWIVVRVHYPDVGGMAAGSITPDATEVYQEGLRLPPLKVYERGKPSDLFTDLFFSNVRMPEERRGDFMAVVGAFWTAEKRLREIVSRFGYERIVETHRITSDRSAHRLREAIRRLPEGDTSYELNLNSTGASPGWVPLRVELTVRHTPEPTITVDFSESSPAVPGPMNGAPATAACAAFIAIKSFLDPMTPINGGSFLPIRIVTKPHTIFEAQPPTAMCGSLDLGYRALELVMGALAAVVPQNAVGDHSSPTHHYLPVWDEKRNRHYVFYECPVGGTGAVSDHDGHSALAGFERGDFPRISSVEIWEHQVPFLAIENTLIPDSGGAGQYRGGLGIRRSWQLLESTSSVSDLSEPCLIPGYGVGGAYGGAPSTCRVLRGNEVLWPGGVTGTGKATRFPLVKADIVQFHKWGGGGFGDPLLRETDRVLEDLREGLISDDAALNMYGVVIVDGRVQRTATEERRRHLEAQRVFVSVSAAAEDMAEGNTRLFLIGPALARSLQATDGQVLECLSNGRPPLRALARIDSQSPSDQLAIGPVGRKVLGVASGKVWIRAVPGSLYPPPRTSAVMGRYASA